MFSCWLSVCLSVVCTSVRPSVRTSFPFDSLSIYKRISFKVCICICTNNVSLGIVIGDKFRQFITELWRLSMYKKWFLASSSFTIWNIMIKRHKYDRSNKSSILAKKYCHLRLSALAVGLYTCIKSWKKYICKIRVQSCPSETYPSAMTLTFRSGIG